MTQTPICERMCGTCPFRPGSRYAHLAAYLGKSAITTGSRQCHQTGTNAIGGRTGKSVKLCRGARDFQLQHLHRIGFLSEPTDAAWTAKCAELGIRQDTPRRQPR